MKHLHFLAFALCWLVWGHLLKAQSIDHYSSLDPSQPIEFKGNCLRYADKEIILGPKTFFVDVCVCVFIKKINISNFFLFFLHITYYKISATPERATNQKPLYF